MFEGSIVTFGGLPPDEVYLLAEDALWDRWRDDKLFAASANDSLPAKDQTAPPTQPDAPFFPLNTWNELFKALNGDAKPPTFKNTEANRNRIRKFHDQYGGPIVFPGGKGTHPVVSKASLLQWWAEVAEKIAKAAEAAQAKAESARLTVASTSNFGQSGTVAHDIGGSVKQSKAGRAKKPKDTKR
ncbi:hypothetical protein PX52LOC_01548 [Limnoglobus roseus]|uniref:Uncharacterized protein n=2 Tax=Limnoglobus roseus TaxID=2598579 RepID=A0A5C1A828_9BACT|nr:hypothetical protein PX52LOC_01548 [Limnoglobus roseus]